MKQCDFCSAHPPILCCYPCRSFGSDSRSIGVAYRGHTVELQSIDEWQACRTCSLLIDVMDLEGLIDRACEAFKLGHAREAFRQHISYTYQLFFTNRIEG